ncbi:MAG: hypothetical protein ACI9HK_005694 [Pirellulaceae bacterium]|jgi:hypothetical protein
MRPTGIQTIRPIALSLVVATFWLTTILHSTLPNRLQANEVDFKRDVFSILQERCISCHGADEQEGQLRLDAKSMVLHGGVSGPAVRAGHPDKSLLLQRILGAGEVDRMPLDEDPLSDAEVATLTKWIKAGANWPAGIGANIEVGKRHWAYIAPQKTPLPKVQQQDWPQNPVDYFTLAKMEQNKFSPSQAAAPANLIRRVHLDLTGLPPTVEEVDAFVRDPTREHYLDVVDRLLKSPRYGERWARLWLDLARYADSNGYQADQYRNVWPYRDWVINAFNSDMPFDQFTIEQIAGDLLPNATVEQKIATGFHRLTTCNVEAGVDPEENRVEQLIDRVNTTGTVWLGTTLECAQCHNHKYDPFTQKDYYQLFAYFNNTPLEVEGNGVTYNFTGPKMALPLAPDMIAQKQLIADKIAQLKDNLVEFEIGQRADQATWEASLKSPQDANFHVLEILEFQSQGGASHRVLDDQSVLVTGAKPATDVYVIEAKTTVQKITGFRLETLTHDELPGMGPGRHEGDRPNFVLNEFKVERLLPNDLLPNDPLPNDPLRNNRTEVVKLHSAVADFSQKNFAASGAIDENPKTAWAISPAFGKDHEATFLTSSPISHDGELTFRITLDQQHGEGRCVGRPRISVMTGQRTRATVPKAVQKILGIELSKRTAGQKTQLQNYYFKQSAKHKQLTDAIAAMEAEATKVIAPTTLVMIEMPKGRDSFLFKRGDFLNKGAAVTANTPAILHKTEDIPGNRLGLARWLSDAQNPLVGRVAINRWWSEIFGRGIVSTEEDFGTQGEPPTHQALLDWLAADFVESGWSMKHIHRLIVTSATYQQASALTDEAREKDLYNLFYARGARLRLSAELIRDNALQISGLLSTKAGGPPIFPPQPENIWRHVGRNAPTYATSTGPDRFRRGIYVIWRRSAPYPSFVNFDAPDRASCTVKRPHTNTPLQALTLLNDPAYVELAMGLARRMLHDLPNSKVEERITYGFRRCVSREPNALERSHLTAVFLRERERLAKDSQAAKAVAGPIQDGESVEELGAWFLIANILLNLDETITKG